MGKEIEKIRHNCKGVKPEFVDLIMYGVYYAAYDLLKEKTWKIVWKAGEVVFNEIKDKLGITGGIDLFEALRRMADWLREMGYVEYIEVKRISEDEFEYIMKNPIITPGAKRLVEQGKVPAHISTALMFAILKQYNMKAEMIGKPKFLSDGRAIEKWKLIKLAEN
ncbi:MAG: hypothetical protein NDF56_08050 [archaeon GB-1845-036]|nr:hypothetical protein [Candidatus Culexmicrobium thermophilum]RLE52959.1 MAG: hypothetical protein DRJ30_07340 [Candidatus Verstraetearchaeota archaeon]